MKCEFVSCATLALIALTGCGGGGDSPPASSSSSSSSSGGGGLPPASSAPALKAELAAKYGTANFPIGAAIEPASTSTAPDSALLLKHFSSVTAENAMKPDTLWPNAPGSTTLPASSPNFVPADTIYNYALANNIQVRGHTLLWHQTAPSWFFAGDTSNATNYRATVATRLCQYIDTVMKHYPQIYAWDVVNEVASDTQNSSNPYRTSSPWYQAFAVGGNNGGDYVALAFACANQSRIEMGKNSGNLKLMLNDYNTELPGKRANVMQIVQSLVTGGIPIDGVGHQFHLQIDADVSQVTAAFQAVEAISSTLVNHVTELDVSIYADPGTCYSSRTIPPCLADVGTTAPQATLSAQALKYRALFNAFDRESVTSISFWGIADNHTWLNTFPVNRTNHPLLFDRSGNPKAAFWAVVSPSFTP